MINILRERVRIPACPPIGRERAGNSIIPIAGKLGNRTQLLLYRQDNGVEDREGHQPPKHSQYLSHEVRYCTLNFLANLCALGGQTQLFGVVYDPEI